MQSQNPDNNNTKNKELLKKLFERKYNKTKSQENMTSLSDKKPDDDYYDINERKGEGEREKVIDRINTKRSKSTPSLLSHSMNDTEDGKKNNG